MVAYAVAVRNVVMVDLVVLYEVIVDFEVAVLLVSIVLFAVL